MRATIRFYALLHFALIVSLQSIACDNTPLLVVYDPLEIVGDQWNLEVFVCFGSEESEDGFTLESSDASINILNATPNPLQNPLNGNYADALFSGGLLNYYYDNSDGSNFNDANGETGPCVDFNITVDSDPTGTSFTMAGVNDGCDYTISTANLTSEVTFSPACSADLTLIAPGSITSSTESASASCNFRSPVFSTIRDEIIEVIIPCDGDYTFSLCGSSFDTWMAISNQCCFLPFASNDNYCSSQSEMTVDLLAGTYYILVEGFLWDDFGDYTLNVTSSSDGVSISSIDVLDPQCSMSDAEITIHSSGNDGPFTYSIDGGSTFFTDSVFTGLSAGNYFIIARGQSGCIASEVLSINTNPPLVLDGIVNTPASCSANNGQIQINVSAGTGPYQYSIDNGQNFQNSNTFNSLSGGEYLIRVSDLNGCEVNTIVSVDSSSTPTINQLIISSATCGLGTGQVEIIASGDSELSYSIDGTTFQSSPIFTGLMGGFYGNITVQTANSCTIDTTLFLPDIPSPTFDQIIVGASNCDTTGSIEIIVSGGGGMYTYSIDGGINYSSTNVFNNLDAGSYTVQVMDDNLCIIDSIIQLNLNTSISIDNLVIVDPVCDPSTGNISNNGSIVITASGGSSTLEYSIDDGQNYQASNTFSSLSYGAYSISVSDGTCTLDSLVSLRTNPGPTIEILDARDLVCGEENGFIAVKVLNATNPNYIYEFDNGTDNIQSAPTTDDQYSYSQFTEGIWNIIVSDGDGCLADTAIELSILPDIAITNVIIDSVYCGQNDGAFTIIASSGSLPIEYSLSSDFSTSQGNGFFSGLTAGSYTVYLRDARFCRDTIQIDLTNIYGVILDSISTVNPTCLDHNGEITIHVSDGAPPYFYSVDNGLNFQTGNHFSGLHDETYEILVIDAAGCIVTASVTLVEEGSLNLEISLIPVNCNTVNGEIHLLAIGGDNNFTYTIDNGASQSNTSGIFTSLFSGFYEVSVEDGQGCIAYDNIFIDSLATLVIDSIHTTEANCGTADGAIQFFANGGQFPYEYSIDDGFTYSTSSLFENLTEGSYSIVIRDSLNCTDSSNVEILANTQISISSIILSDPNCGDSSGSAIIFVENATLPLQYILNSIDTNSYGSFDDLNAGDYTIQVIDSSLCTTDSIFTLVDSLVANPTSITIDDFSTCMDSVIISANDPSPSSGLWTSLSSTSNIISPNDSVTTAYDLTLGENQFVWTISNGICPNTSDTLTIGFVDEVIVDAGEDEYKFAVVPVLLIASSNIIGDYSWTPSQYLTDPTIYNPIAQVDESTQFIVNVSNEFGCFGVDSMWIYIANEIEYASAFTPDGDGNNDTWIINNIEFFPGATVTIMNRYGNIVFESTGYAEAWDGKYDGKDVPVGSYFYIIELGSNFETQSGSVSVIR